MSAATEIRFDLHVDETWAWCEFASADDLARFEAAGLSPELHKVVVPPRPPHNEREFPAVMTAKDFREIVEVFRILKRVRDEGR